MVLLLTLGALAAEPPSHCPAPQQTIFSCPARGGKVISVCLGPNAGSASYLQYKFGPLGAPELVYPKSPLGFSSFRQSHQTLINGESHALVFANEGVQYEVWSTDGPQGGGGVNVRKDGKFLATVSCTGEYVERWSELADHVPVGTGDDLGKVTCATAASRYADVAFRAANGQMDGMQQGEIHDGVKEQCEAGWAPAAIACYANATALAACVDQLTPTQRAALPN